MNSCSRGTGFRVTEDTVYMLAKMLVCSATQRFLRAGLALGVVNSQGAVSDSRSVGFRGEAAIETAVRVGRVA